LAFVLFVTLSNGQEIFETLAAIVLALGCTTSLFFIFTVNEKYLTTECKKLTKVYKDLAKRDYRLSKSSQNNYSVKEPEDGDESAVDINTFELSEDEQEPMKVRRSSKSLLKKSLAEEIFHWTEWFKQPSFYIYGLVYMGVRMTVNVTSSLMLFYLQYVVIIGNANNVSSIPFQFAVIPMILYLSSTISSASLKKVYIKFGRKNSFSVGAIFVIGSAVVMMTLNQSISYFMYPLAMVIGIGQSIVLNTGITLIGEVVGLKGSSGAFVYGAYSLLDKFSNGIVLFLIMNLKDVSNSANQDYLRIMTCVIPGSACLLAWMLVLVGKAKDYNQGLADAVYDPSESFAKPSK